MPLHAKSNTCVCQHRSIMTYDYSATTGAQPNAPMWWLDSNMQLLTGGE